MEIKFKMENDQLVIMAKLNKGVYYGKRLEVRSGQKLDVLYDFIDQVKYEIKVLDTYGPMTRLVKDEREERTSEENDEIWKNF